MDLNTEAICIATGRSESLSFPGQGKSLSRQTLWHSLLFIEHKENKAPLELPFSDDDQASGDVGFISSSDTDTQCELLQVLEDLPLAEPTL